MLETLVNWDSQPAPPSPIRDPLDRGWPMKRKPEED